MSIRRVHGHVEFKGSRLISWVTPGLAMLVLAAIPAIGQEQIVNVHVLTIPNSPPIPDSFVESLAADLTAANSTPASPQIYSKGPPTHLTIVPTFDSTITSDPNAATIESTINAAIKVYEAAFSDNITVNIKFAEMVNPPPGALGGSSTMGFIISYSSYLSALNSHATTANDATALAHLAAGPNNPVNGNANMSVASALVRALGMSGSVSLDSTISFNIPICNLNRNNIDPNKYDLMSVAMHEMDEALSFGSALDNLANGNPTPTGPIKPADLFRYDQSGNRSFNTTLNSPAFFSIDGSFPLAQFNQDAGAGCTPPNCADFGDWNSDGPHIPKVQDSNATPGATPNLTVELVRLDVVGYSLVPLPTISTDGSVTFANTCVGTTNYASLNVCNTGTADLLVGAILSTNPAFSVVPPSSGYPVVISPDFCFPFRVQFSPTAPGAQRTRFIIPNNDPTSPTNFVQGFANGVTTTLSAVIVTNGDFGDVCLGSFKDQTITINNSGGCALYINNITSSDSTEFLVPTVVSYPLLLQPGDSIGLPFRFQPTGAFGSRNATIYIYSNDQSSPTALPVRGRVPSGKIVVTGDANFGDVCAGTLAEKTISICNVSNCDLHVTGASLTNCPDFTLINNPFPNTISPDSCLQLVVRFTPTSCGSKSCTLTITSDDPLHPSVSLPVTANMPCPSIDVPPDLGFAPEVITSIGPCSEPLPFPISNKGNCNLTITNIWISGVNAGDFGFSGLPSFPIILQPGDIVGAGDLNVTFAPTAVARARTATLNVTYITDPISGATTTVTRKLCGEGVLTGARVLVMQGGVPLAGVDKIQLQRLTVNKSGDVVQQAPLVTVVPPGPCGPFQYHREYGTVSNPIQLLAGDYQITVSATINGKHKSLSQSFSLDTCDFNPAIVINF
ncbi:MAG: hypothetical protein C5B50_28965 [Verrucomicrobia bacterium]|nr:MAG: hypothetical protein C5B50_28965 [Verrucomicrobiota bacterium]